MTDADWKRQLAEAHPDRGGDPAVFRAIAEARACWVADHPICRGCGRPFLVRHNGGLPGYRQIYCTSSCANKANAKKRRLRLLRSARRMTP